MNIEIIKYQYTLGVYSLNDLIKLVKEKQITEKDFFEITRKYYWAVLKTQKMGDTY